MIWLARGFVSLACVLVPFQSVHGQTDYRSFTVQFENDSKGHSDSSYTNGVRLSWTLLRSRPGMSLFTSYGFPSLLRLVRADRVGLIPDQLERQECQPNEDRNNRRKGACYALNLGIGQNMYTPDSLAGTSLQPFSHPYAGFLFVNFGATTIDAPYKHGHPAFAFTQFSNQVILGVTGQAAQGEDTQSLAHWVASTDSHRPLGWRNQLRQAVEIGLQTDNAYRPRGWEVCAAACDGLVEDGRIFDVTPHTELVAGTFMVRATEGVTARLGYGFPDVLTNQRIPVSLPQRASDAKGGGGICDYWGYVFVNVVGRYWPYNIFVEGGLPDGGPSGWRPLRQIDPRRLLAEGAIGLVAGNSRFSFVGQFARRTNEFDVRGLPHTVHPQGYLSLALTIQPPRYFR